MFLFRLKLLIKEIILDAETYPLEFLYDGQCRICMFDVVRLRRADNAGRLRFIDVSAPGFDAAVYGRTVDDLLARIHARRADGVVLEGPEVFRLALAAVGYGWLVAPTRWPGLAWITERGYRWFARHRVELSHRFGGIFARWTPACDGDVCHRPTRGSGS
jgi:predicted DCC family thiol-disulfide oxidoreductase YuxK